MIVSGRVLSPGSPGPNSYPYYATMVSTKGKEMRHETEKGKQFRHNIGEMSEATIRALTLFAFAGAMYAIALSAMGGALPLVWKVPAGALALSSLVIAVIGFLNTVLVLVLIERLMFPNLANTVIENIIVWVLSALITLSAVAGFFALVTQVHKSLS